MIKKATRKIPVNIARVVVIISLVGLSVLLGQEPDSPKRYGKEISNREQRLEKIRKQIRQNEAAAKQLSKKERSLLAQLQGVEKSIDLTTSLLDQLSAEEIELGAEIAGIADALVQAEDRFVNKKTILNRNIRTMYKLGREHQLKILISANSVTNLLQRWYYLSLTAKTHKKLIGQIEELRGKIASSKEARENKLGKLTRYRKEKEIEKENLDNSVAHRKNLLATVKQERGERNKAVAQLKAQAEQLTNLIEELERQRLAAIEEAKRKRQPTQQPFVGAPLVARSIPWPVVGEVVSRFGTVENEIYETKVFNPGIDIAAELGAPIKAVGAGEVMFADWYLTYGKMVILGHGSGFYSLYGHVSDILVPQGTQVQTHQIIAKVGDTGSLDGSKLHFEIRRGRQAVDPLAWLAAR